MRHPAQAEYPTIGEDERVCVLGEVMTDREDGRNKTTAISRNQNYISNEDIRHKGAKEEEEEEEKDFQ